jgi:hypothetical protein
MFSHNGGSSAEIGRGVARGGGCMQRAARPNCHTSALSNLAAGRGKAASMPAAARPHCILHARDLGMLAPKWGTLGRAQDKASAASRNDGLG